MTSVEEKTNLSYRLMDKSAVGEKYCSRANGNRGSNQATAYFPYQTKHLNKQVPDYSCFADVHSVKTQWQQGKVLIMDVRKPEAYRQYHIPGSLNLPLHSIKHKKHFKNSTIALINKGLSYRFLLDACTQLKNGGFKQISVVKGGLKSWFESGYSLNNRKAPLKQLSEISPYEYFNASMDNNWVFIDLDQSSDQLRSLIPSARIIKLTGDFSAFDNNLQEFKRSQKNGNEITFIAINKSGNNYQFHKGLLPQYERVNAFYLSGGVTGLQHYMQKHLALLERQKKGFQVKMGCGR
jgi:rhodanese-related sulfurtransferase